MNGEVRWARFPLTEPIEWETGPVPANTGWVRFEGWLPTYKSEGKEVTPDDPD